MTFESFDFNWNNFQMGEWNSTAQGSGEVISPVIPKFDSLIESLSRKDFFLWRVNGDSGYERFRS